MGAKVEIPWDVGKYIQERHGRDVLIVSRKDWEKVRKVVKKHPETYEKLKALDIVLSPVVLRGGLDAVTVVAKRELARRRKR